MNIAVNIPPVDDNSILPRAGMPAPAVMLTAMPFEVMAIKPTQFNNPASRPIPGFEPYRIDVDGTVYGPSGILIPFNPRRYVGAQVRLRRNGYAHKRSISKLLALVFIPNPDNYDKVIHLDRDCKNCALENLQWVSDLQFFRHVKDLDANEALLGPPRRRSQKRAPDWIDPFRIPVEGYPDYYITPSAVLYRKDFIVKPAVRKQKYLKVRLRLNGKHAKYAGLAKLVAEHFVDNPRDYKYVIFKDRNPHNCHYRNLAWVDNETWMEYCNPSGTGRKKRAYSKEEAIRRCTDVHMCNFYKSGDHYWLQECWKEIEEKVRVNYWNAYRSECYMYFLDRAERYSIFKNPVSVILGHMRNMRWKEVKEASAHMPDNVVRQNDESLRILQQHD